MDSTGRIFIADYKNTESGGTGRVVVLSATGALLHIFPNASDPVASSYHFSYVTGVAVDSTFQVFVADQATAANGGYGRIVVLSATGALLHAFPNASNPATNNTYKFNAVYGVAVDSASGVIYVADYQTADGGYLGYGRVVVLSSTGSLMHAFPDVSSPISSNYQFRYVSGVAVGGAGTIYVSDFQTSANGGYGRVVVLSPDGALLNIFPNASTPISATYQLASVEGVAVDDAGRIYVCDFSTQNNGGFGRLVVLSANGAALHSLPDTASPATSSYQFDFVAGVAVSSTGTVYVVDYEAADNGGKGRVVVLAGLNATASSTAALSSTASSSPASSSSSSVGFSSSSSLLSHRPSSSASSSAALSSSTAAPYSSTAMSTASIAATSSPLPPLSSSARSSSVLGDPMFECAALVLAFFHTMLTM